LYLRRALMHAVPRMFLIWSRVSNLVQETYPGSEYNLHAEMHACMKLKPNYGRPIDVNLIVVRINLVGDILGSLPCEKCCKHLSKVRGYNIKRIYYTVKDGITYLKWSELLEMYNSNKLRMLTKHRRILKTF
jgi:hypothetical protein